MKTPFILLLCLLCVNVVAQENAEIPIFSLLKMA